MIPIIIYGIAVSVCLVVSLIISFVLVVWLRTKSRKYHATTTVTGLALTVTFLLVLMIPVDVFSVSFMKDSNGKLKDWAADPSTRQYIHQLIRIFYYVMFFLISIFLFAILPFFYFLYDEVNEVNEDTSKRWKTAFLYTPLVMSVFLFILLAGAFIPVHDSSENSTTINMSFTYTPAITTAAHTTKYTTITTASTTKPKTTTVATTTTAATTKPSTTTTAATTKPSTTTTAATTKPSTTTTAATTKSSTTKTTATTKSSTTTATTKFSTTTTAATTKPLTTTTAATTKSSTTTATTKSSTTTATTKPLTTTTAATTKPSTTIASTTTKDIKLWLPVTSSAYFELHGLNLMDTETSFLNMIEDSDVKSKSPKKEALTKLHFALGYTYCFIVLCGIFTTCFYTAHGMTLIPFKLMGCRCTRDYVPLHEEDEYVIGNNATDSHINTIYNGGNDIDEFGDGTLRRKSLYERLKCIIMPFRITIALFNLLVSLILLVSLTIVCAEKWKNSNFYKGYNVEEFTLFNPADYIITHLQRFFPLDYILFLMMLGSLITASLYSLKVVGIRFLFIKLYRVRAGRTVPQALIFFALYSLLMVFSFGNILYAVLPTYITYGHQSYVVGDKVMKCESQLLDDQCISTSISDFITQFNLKVPFFGAATFYALNLFIFCYVIGIFISLYRVCCEKKLHREILSDISDDVSLDIGED